MKNFKKSIILLTAITLIATSVGNLVAKELSEPAKAWVDFISMEEGHADKMIALKKSKADKMFGLKKEMVNHKMAYFSNFIKALDNVKTEDEKDEFLKSQLQKKVALHKQFKTKIKELYQEFHAEAEKLFEQFKQELSAFENANDLNVE